MNKPSTIIQLALEIEERAGDIYLRMSRMFHHVQTVSELWSGLMKEENAHANILKDANDNLQEQIQEIHIDDKIRKNITATHEWIMTDLLDNIHNLDDAYELSHRLETTEVEMLFDLLSNDIGKHIDKLRIVMFEEQGHLQKLIDFSEDYGNAKWRKGIKAQ